MWVRFQVLTATSSYCFKAPLPNIIMGIPFDGAGVVLTSKVDAVFLESDSLL
jgi:hypothetical protein